MERGQKDDTDVAALLASEADEQKASFDVLLVDEAIGALMTEICGLGRPRIGDSTLRFNFALE